MNLQPVQFGALHSVGYGKTVKPKLVSIRTITDLKPIIEQARLALNTQIPGNSCQIFASRAHFFVSTGKGPQLIDKQVRDVLQKAGFKDVKIKNANNDVAGEVITTEAPTSEKPTRVLVKNDEATARAYELKDGEYMEAPDKEVNIAHLSGKMDTSEKGHAEDAYLADLGRRGGIETLRGMEYGGRPSKNQHGGTKRRS